MRWMLNAFPRSNHHSAINLPFPDIVHWFPAAASFEYSPSRAQNAPQRVSWEYSCHAVLCNAMFYVNNMTMKHIAEIITTVVFFRNPVNGTFECYSLEGDNSF